MLKDKILFIFCLLIFVMATIQAQNNTLYNISFENETIFSAFSKLEKVTSKKIFYKKSWIDTSIKISKNFERKELKFILDEILDEINLNYIFYNDTIILTNKSIIVTKLPKNFFEEKKQGLKKNTPIYAKGLNQNKNLIIVGREHSQKQKYYIIKGKIIDLSTNKPIPNVAISLAGKNHKTKTDKNGNYILKSPYGYHKLIVKGSNYNNIEQSIIVYGGGLLDLTMMEKSQNLDVVVITGKLDNNIKKARLGVTKINAKTVKVVPLVFGERDILKVATTMPGVKTAGEGSLGYNVRGGKVDQNLILFDNATIYNPSHFFGVFSAINPYSTESVTIYKGSLPTEYGGRLSSIIDIKTKKVSNNKFKGEGNFGAVTSNLMLEIPLIKDKTAILTGFRTTYSDWVLKKIKNESLKNSEVSFLDGIVRLDSKINDKNQVYSTVYYSKDKFSISSDSTFQYQNKLASFEWKYKINKKNKLSVQLNNSKYKFNIFNEGDYNTNFDINFSILENQLKLKVDKIINTKHNIVYGISTKLYNINPGEIKPLGSESIINYKVIPKEKGVESGVFISDKYKISKKLLFKIGLRFSSYAFLGETNQNIYAENKPHSEDNIIETIHYNKNEVVKTYSNPELRLSARYLLTDDFSFKVGFDNTVQYLHLLSSNTTASPIDTWKLSNLNIEPQKSTQFSAGLFKNFKDKIYEVSLEGYYKKMNNILEYKIGADLLLNENIENDILPGEGESYGVEFLIRKNNGKFNGWLGYSYSRSFVRVNSILVTNQINNGEYFPANYDKPHDLSLIMNYKLTKRYSFSLNFIYQTGRPITYPIGQYEFGGIEHVLYSNRNEFRIPDYYRLDLGVNIEGNHKIKKIAHSFWNISVYNVLGRNNPYSIYFVNEGGKIQAYQSSIFASPIPTISYNFKF